MVARSNLAFTGPINPPDAPFVLSQAQVWAGLERKIRRGQEFVPVIESCEVIEEKVEDGIPVTVREAKFKEGQGPPTAKANGNKVREVCKAYEPSRVDFLQPDGSTVSNIISHGADGEIYMTYAFEWKREDLDGADEATKAKAREVYIGMAKVAVTKSIEAIREMVKDGRITV